MIQYFPLNIYRSLLACTCKQALPVHFFLFWKIKFQNIAACLLSLGELFNWEKLLENIGYLFRYLVPKLCQIRPAIQFVSETNLYLDEVLATSPPLQQFLRHFNIILILKISNFFRMANRFRVTGWDYKYKRKIQSKKINSVFERGKSFILT